MLETLQKRLEVLENCVKQQDAQIQQMVSNRNMLEGARQEILILISELNKPVIPQDDVGKQMTSEEFKEKVE